MFYFADELIGLDTTNDETRLLRRYYVADRKTVLIILLSNKKIVDP
jgi:hypothetical protein